MYRFALLCASFGLGLVLSACGDSDATSSRESAEAEVSKDSVKTIYDLGECTKKRNGEMVYVQKDDSYHLCKGGNWLKLEATEVSPSSEESSSSLKKKSSSSSAKSSSSSKSKSSSSAKSSSSEDLEEPEISEESSSSQVSSSQRYAQIFECFRKEARAGILKDVVLWGITDKMSWKNNFPAPGRGDAPLLFDVEGKEKPAFTKLLTL